MRVSHMKQFPAAYKFMYHTSDSHTFGALGSDTLRASLKYASTLKLTLLSRLGGSIHAPTIAFCFSLTITGKETINTDIIPSSYMCGKWCAVLLCVLPNPQCYIPLVPE